MYLFCEAIHKYANSIVSVWLCKFPNQIDAYHLQGSKGMSWGCRMLLGFCLRGFILWHFSQPTIYFWMSVTNTSWLTHFLCSPSRSGLSPDRSGPFRSIPLLFRYDVIAMSLLFHCIPSLFYLFPFSYSSSHGRSTATSSVCACLVLRLRIWEPPARSCNPRLVLVKPPAQSTSSLCLSQLLVD